MIQSHRCQKEMNSHAFPPTAVISNHPPRSSLRTHLRCTPSHSSTFKSSHSSRHKQSYRRVCSQAGSGSSGAQSPPDESEPSVSGRSHETDVVVIGSGIGGLCCAALLARYGLSVTVCESHTIPGGAAHSWQVKGYHFESGPSLYSGMASRGTGANPLSHVYQVRSRRHHSGGRSCMSSTRHHGVPAGSAVR
jgi:hypothetical protein